MKISLPHLFALLIYLVPIYLLAQDDEIDDLSSLAEQFVAAYNEKDIEGISELYTSEAELVDDGDVVYASGIAEIQAVFEESFLKFPERRVSLEVLSVRRISADVVIEEGFAYFSEKGDGEDIESVGYSAVLVKEDDQGWRIGSSREIRTEEETHDLISELYPLAGEWILQGDQLKMSLSLALSPTGKFIVGAAQTTTPDEGTMTTDIRIGQDPSSGQIRWWTFDEAGGFAQGHWQKEDDRWLVRTNGTTADGEKTTAIQNLTFENDDNIVWESTHRFIDGQPLPDAELRLVRSPPAPEVMLTNLKKENSSDSEISESSEDVE